MMTSVYFPAHVFVLFRRIVNVVSTLSISNHYYAGHTRPRQLDDSPRLVEALDGLPDTRMRLSKTNMEPLKNMESNLRTGWNTAIDKAEALLDERPTPVLNEPGRVLKATLDLPKWLSRNWSMPNLFSFQPQLDGPEPENDTPPPTSPKSSRKESEPLKEKETRPDPPKRNHEFPQQQLPPDIIHQLLANPALFEPLRTPRFPIVLSHGLYGFDSRGPVSFPSMRMHYWSNVLSTLRGKVGAEVIVTSVPGTGSITSRALKLDEQLKAHARGRGINFLAHSMGGLDCRHLISHIRPKEYVPLSLTSISTPHRGSPFMDWCASNIGIGKLRQQEKELKAELQRSSQRDLHLSSSEYDDDDYAAAHSASVSRDSRSASTSHTQDNKEDKSPSGEPSFSLSSLPSSFTHLILSVVDSPAYANLTSHYLNKVFNPATPDDPNVKYFSVAGRMSGKSVNVWHPFWLPKMVLDGTEETEREKLKKIWEDTYHTGGKEWRKEDGTPLWANEREWGNDGLVTVQSAKWGKFLGIIEGADHWEMRGARGIEFGVDLPAIPAIGLGSAPPVTSTSGRSDTVAPPQVQGDGWGFGDWTRFVGAWKKSKDSADAATLESAESSSGASINPSTTRNPDGKETPTERQKREKEEDDFLKSSTDRLSVVFDWLIERVPDAGSILGSSSSIGEKGSPKEGVRVDLSKDGGDKAMHAKAVVYTVGGSGSSQKASESKQPPPSEMKKRMQREDTGREKRNELARKEDLERFYVALARKMYDAGL